MKAFVCRLALFLCLFSLWSRPAPGADETQVSKQHKPVLLHTGQMHWSDDPEIRGGSVALLWGDPKTGSYGSLNQWPAGTIVPLHTHTYESRGIVLSGVLILSIRGIPTELGPGSYAYVPGGQEHVTACMKGVDCLFFVEQPGKADIQYIKTKE